MEKVTEERIPATNWRRIFAYGLDSLVAGASALIVWLEAELFQKESGVFGYSLHAIAAVFIAYFFYHWLFIYFLGGTPGKLMMGLRIVSKNQEGGGPAGLGLMQSFLRVLADQLSFFVGHGLRVLVLMRLDRTHVSDWVAETQVVQFDKRSGPVRRHLFWALALCLWFSCGGFMKIYSQFQRLSWVGNRVFFQPPDNR